MEAPQMLVVDLPADGLDWGEATRAVPGSRVHAQVESIRRRGDGHQLTLLVRATGFPAQALVAALGRITARDGKDAVDVLDPPGAAGTLLRTCTHVAEPAPPAAAFLVRAHGSLQSASASFEGGRLQVRGVPRAQPGAQDAQGLLAYARMLGGSAELRAGPMPAIVSVRR